MGKRYSVEQRAAWVSEQQESGLSVAAFCDWIGLSQNSFYLWLRKLRAMETSGRFELRFNASPQETKARPVFLPLGVIGSPMIDIDLACGAVVRVPNEELSLRRGLGILVDACERLTLNGESRTTTLLPPRNETEKKQCNPLQRDRCIRERVMGLGVFE